MDALKVHLKKTLATAGVFLVASTLYLPITIIVISAYLSAWVSEAIDRLLGMILWLETRPEAHWYFEPGRWLDERSYFG